MLRRPLVLALAAVVVSPNDFVQEALATKERIEQHLGIVRLTIIKMQVKRAGFVKQSPCLFEARFKK